MLNIKKGDVLKWKNNKTLDTIKILAVVDGLYAFSWVGNHESFKDWCTEKDLRDTFILPEEKWEPAKFEDFWFVTSEGTKQKAFNDPDFPFTQRLIAVGNYFKTPEEAEAKLNEVLAVLKK